MSVTSDNVIQANSGTSASGAFSVTVGSGTAAGNTVIVVVVGGVSLPITPPSGWVTAKTAESSSIRISVFYLSDVAASQTSWTFTPAAGAAIWWVREMSNLDLADPVDVTANNSASTANNATISSGTTARCAGLSTIGIAVYATSQASGVTHSFSGYTNGFTETVDFGLAASFHMAVADAYLDGSTGTFGSTATYTASDSNSAVIDATVVVFRAADAPVAAPLSQISSLGKWQTYGGMGNANPNNPHGGQQGVSVGTNVLVVSGGARDGGYGLEITESAANNNVPLAPGSWGYSALAAGHNVRVRSGSGVVVVDRFTTSVSGTFDLVYDVSNTKFGMRWGTGGTVSYQTGTTAIDAWVWFDCRVKVNSATLHMEWWLEGVPQTSPADVTGATPGTVTGLTLANATQTMVAQYSDFVASRYYVAGPLGQHWFQLLVPETTGASVSGTSTNFSKFTANGTLAAWGSDAGALLDEVPPTVSASSDGVVQTATAATEYMQFPMSTYTCASDEMIAAVRALAPAWGGTGAGTGTLGLRGYDGTTETTIVAASTSYDGDSLTAVSATYPLWIHGLWPAAGAGWTQTMLNNAALRVGFSTDATPDMGVSALYLEVAIKKASTVRQITLEDPMSATVDLYMNTDTSASVSYLITNNDATRSVNFNYSISGAPQTPVTVGPSSSQPVQVNADSFGDVNPDGLEPQ